MAKHLARALLLSALLATSVALVAGGWRSKSKKKAEPVGKQLFNEGPNALSWDSDILEELGRLQKEDFADKEAYLSSSNLADYLGMHYVSGMHMPVPLSIVLVGFGADGNGKVNISDVELQEWFEQLDHVLPHTRVALSELNCQEDGHCAGLLQGEMRPSPLSSYVHLNFSCEVVVVQRKAVLDSFERAIFAFSRPEDPLDPKSPFQVDALKMEAFIDHFIASLGLGGQYSLLVVNPKWTPSRPKYGYRAGFSQWEITVMQQHTTSIARFLRDVKPEPELASAWQGPSLGSFHHNKPLTKFATSDVAWSSDQWAKNVDAYLGQEEDHRRNLLRLVGDLDGAPAVVRALKMLKKPSSDMARILERSIYDPSWQVTAARLKFRTSHPLEDCLVHTWVGHGRWIYMDLTAGGFDWGPALGGEGVVTPSSLPSAGDYFATVQTLRDKAQLTSQRSEVEHSLEELLGRMRHSRLADINQKHGHAASLQNEALAPGETAEKKAAQQERRLQEIQLQAELDLLEDFALKHCHGKARAPSVCRDMQRNLGLLQQTLAQLATSSQAVLPAFRDHKWDIFGPEESVDANDEIAGEALRSRDLFMAELSAVLSRGLRHVVAPPTATWHHHGYLHDTATPYASHVIFSIYEITEEWHSIIHIGRNQHIERFDMDAFKSEVQRLQLHAQSFKFHSRELNLLDDPAFAVAFASSLKASFSEVPNADSKPEDHEQVYIDSKELAHRLRKLLPPRRSADTSDWHSHLDVPVFVFNLHRQAPVLVDEHYSAKALEDMVIVVHNAAHLDAHPMGMMCNGALLSRPFSPLKDALAAVLQHLGGVLPPHLGYHPDKHAVTHDWLWSVGAHPFSHTSSGHTYTQLQIDALHRSYLLDAVDASVDFVNRGLELLEQVRSSEPLHELVLGNKAGLQVLLKRYYSLVDTWRIFMNAARELDFSSVATFISELEASSRKFEAGCRELREVLHTHHCVARVGMAQSTIRALVISSTLIATAGLLYALTPAFRKKPKFN